MARHHVPEDMLVAYAAGGLGRSESLLVACHVTLCARCRAAVAEAEAVGAALLASDQAGLPEVAGDVPGDMPSALPGELLDALLARLDDADAADSTTSAVVDPTGVVPAPLYRLVGSLERLSWEHLIPGLDRFELAAGQDRKQVSLIRLAPGVKVPLHRHTGQEATIVLTGGFSDADGHYVRGDVSVRTAEDVHEQRADQGEPCIWLVVADGPIVLENGEPQRG